MEPVILIGRTVKLVPFDISRDAKQLFSMINGSPIELGSRSFPSYDPNELIWKNFRLGPFLTCESFENFLKEITSIQTNLLFCVKDIETNTAGGLVGYANNDPVNLKVRIRFGVASPVTWGTVMTIETSYLMLKHTFELGYRRVDSLIITYNYRTMIYQSRLGYTFEGIMQYYIIGKGITYDVFGMAILDFEWNNKAKASIEQIIKNASFLDPKI
jgi:RimJ/RimL family protein N-acetyltransferase